MIQNKIGFAMTFLLTFLTGVAIAAQMAPARDTPIGQWLFSESHKTEDGIENTAGGEDLTVQGDIRFRTEGERSAMIIDRERHDARVLSPDSAKLFPKGAITVEAWVAIEKTVEWGGILSAVKDQKGWLLGFRQSNFSFVIATDRDGKSELSFARA
ncbi:MAG: hypothetical protein KC931_27625, partial [Candidatus Omnitrophica bacterium]|nr:hypothetical protein [Candidatus Omnitrophota bacterium]